MQSPIPDPPAAQGSRSAVAEGPSGEIANRDLIEHSARFVPRLWRVTERVHCAVGFGLANSTAVLAPEGLVVVDTGESVEEAGDHVAAIRAVTELPVRAVIYSHSHYVDGTAAWLREDDRSFRVFGHERIPETRAKVAGEIGPAYIRRVCLQFGFFLPSEGPDAMPNQGIGPFFFNPNHPRRTPGFLPLTDPIREETELEIAGLRFHFIPAAADSDDSLIIWLPEEGVAINNNVWPALFNIYPLRGESYRDPLLLVEAIDRIRDLDPEHLVGVHGPPISGHDTVRDTLRDYRDAIQYLWDQTVRGINRGLGPEELAWSVRLPAQLERSPLCRQFYGAVPHHVRQIHNGLFGWYGNDAADLFPHPPQVEAQRIVAGFGGRSTVLEQARTALDADDAAWAARLASWLVLADPADTGGRETEAAALRALAQRTSSANVRSVCLTRALELEGTIDPRFLNERPAAEGQVLAADPGRFVKALRVQLDPEKSSGVKQTVAWYFEDSGANCALAVRGGVAEFLTSAPQQADLELRLTLPVWARLWSGKRSLADAVANGEVKLTGQLATAEAFFDLFDLVKLRGR
ncbi:MAG: MBL fold metallo-hydrolase [Myxococcales bacterium]|nr:MBL fold metallo-hydrolase [Myxococcales bacterium]